jgi:DNA polymerase-3 subunit delta
MVALKGKAIDTFIAKPAADVYAVLIYGPDAGLVRERAKMLAAAVLGEALGDPFRSSELQPGDLLAEAARLIDEAAALSLVGGRRFIRVADADDRLIGVVTSLFEAGPFDSLTVFEAGDLPARSKLRAVFEKAKGAVALPSYVEEAGDLAGFIERELKKLGQTASREALGYLAEALVGDRMVARQELAKLALYAGEGGRAVPLSLETAMLCVGDYASQAADTVALLMAAGERGALFKALDRAEAEGVSAIELCRAAQRHFQRLLLARAQYDAGESAAAAVEALKPPVFFKMRPAMQQQVERWSLGKIVQVLDRLLETERLCKGGSALDPALTTARAFMAAASLAR